MAFAGPWFSSLGGLEISIRLQIVNTLQLSASPPPPQKKKKNLVKFQTTNTCSIQKYDRNVKLSHCETVYWLKIAQHAQYTGLSDVIASLTVKSVTCAVAV